LHYVNAGHCPPILRKGTGEMQSLDPTRPVLGFMLEEGFHSERLALAPGDRLLLYTDGVSEATNDSEEEFGPERLAELVAGPSHESMEQRYAHIMEKVTKYADGKFRDDATLLLLAINDASSATAARSAPMRTTA
jgi:phosphoserine phosphatase RsbU/P